MRRLLVLVLAGAAALGVPAVAAAKEITRVRVCGPIACADVTGGGPARSDAASGGLSWPRPVRPAPFYVVRYTVGLAPGEGGPAQTGWSVRWLPSADRMRVRGEDGRPEWLTVLAETRRALARAARGVQPFPRLVWAGPVRLPSPVAPAAWRTFPGWRAVLLT